MAVLTFENVGFAREGKAFLKEINWQVNSGEHWGILGLNGAGKSLLLQMIAGNLWPTSGKLTVLGETFGKTHIPDLRKRIGWVASALQQQLYPQDLAEEIVLSGKFASIGIWQGVTEKELASAKELLITLGGKTLIGKPYQVLSQGEKQLVLIARALMPQPELLILDEPCTGLDLFAREELLQRIATIIKQPQAPTLLFVTHHTEEILPAISQVLMLKSGEIFCQGPREKLFTSEVLADFYQKPISTQIYGEKRVIVYPK